MVHPDRDLVAHFLCRGVLESGVVAMLWLRTPGICCGPGLAIISSFGLNAAMAR